MPMPTRTQAYAFHAFHSICHCKCKIAIGICLLDRRRIHNSILRSAKLDFGHIEATENRLRFIIAHEMDTQA